MAFVKLHSELTSNGMVGYSFDATRTKNNIASVLLDGLFEIAFDGS